MKAYTLQVGNKLFILQGAKPLRYLDLTTDKVKHYPKKGTRAYKMIYKFKKEQK